jgi:hypothetical protein
VAGMRHGRGLRGFHGPRRGLFFGLHHGHGGGLVILLVVVLVVLVIVLAQRRKG